MFKKKETDKKARQEEEQKRNIVWTDNDQLG
jgi:hypothetical protein